MTADEARARFSDAHEGELAPAEREAFEAVLSAEPGVAAEFAAFEAALSAAGAVAAGRDSAPDLLPAVQRRLRAGSRGRFYADRFAQRRGPGVSTPLLLAAIMALVLGLAWAALHTIQSVEITPAPAADGKP